MPSPHLGVQSMICIPPRAPSRWHDSCRIPHTQPMVIGTHCHLSQVLGFRVQALFRLISSEPHPALRVLRQRLPEAAQFFQRVTCTFQNCLSPRCKPPPPILKPEKTKTSCNEKCRTPCHICHQNARSKSCPQPDYPSLSSCT